jgi:UDP-N-acetylmuramoylalanine--D-glutamate ligase
MTPSWLPVEGRKFVVLGLARSGLSIIKWLNAHGATAIAVDDNPKKVKEAKSLGAQIVSSIPWNEVSALVQSPGIPLWKPVPHPITQQARDHNVPIIGDGDIFRQTRPNSRFIGITGTNGKSTTTALVGHILKANGMDCQVGGNIGTPMLDLPYAYTYVLELSSYQLELFSPLNLHISGWLNISPDHLDRHGTLENYVAAKKRIFASHDGQQTSIIGIDDTESEQVWSELSKTQLAIPVSVKNPLNKGIFVRDNQLMDGSEPILDLDSLPTLKGAHNFQNAAVAYGICRAAGLDKNEITQAMSTFPGLAHRQEWVRTIRGISFVNDSKGTNADATAKALMTYNNIYWIAGGKAKEEGIDSLAPFFPKIKHTFLIGEAQDRFSKTLEGKVPYTKSGTLEQAIADSCQQAKADGVAEPVILLSPACASFDQFEDFEHRGRVFCQLVQALEA